MRRGEGRGGGRKGRKGRTEVVVVLEAVMLSHKGQGSHMKTC